jgi:hypothetical protein
VVGADSSDLILELVGVLGLEVLSVGGKDELVTRLNLGTAPSHAPRTQHCPCAPPRQSSWTWRRCSWSWR